MRSGFALALAGWLWLAASPAAQAFRIVDVEDSSTINPLTGQPFGETGFTAPATDGKTVVFVASGSVWSGRLDGTGLTRVAAEGATAVPGGAGTFVNINLAGGPRLDGGKVIFTGQDSAGTNEYGYFSSDPSGQALKVIYAPPAASNPIQTYNGADFWAQGGVIVFFGHAGSTSGGNWEIAQGGRSVTWLARDTVDQCSGTNTGIFPIENWSQPFTDGTNLLEVGSSTFNYALLQGNTLANFEVAAPTSNPPGPCIIKYYDSATLPGQPQYGGYVPQYSNLVGAGGDVYVLARGGNGNAMPSNGGGANDYSGIFRISGKSLAPSIVLNNVDPLPLPGFRNADGTKVAAFHLSIQSFSARDGRLVVAVNNEGNYASGSGPNGGLVSALYALRAGKFSRIVGTGDTLSNGFVVGNYLGVQPYAISADGHVAFWLEQTHNVDYGFHGGTFVTRLP